MKPVVRLLKTKLNLDRYKANFAINLWPTVQQSVPAAAFCLDCRWLQIKMPNQVWKYAVQSLEWSGSTAMSWYWPAVKQQFEVFTIQLASTQHKIITYIRYQGVTEVLNEGRILLSLTDKSLLYTFPPALEVLCHFITTKFRADKPRSGNHVSRMALIHMIV